MRLASFFQCCRTDVGNVKGVEDGRRFILNAEFLRDSLQGLGYSVDRIYNSRVTNGDYTADPTPRRFGDQTNLPGDLMPPFAWDGNAQAARSSSTSITATPAAGATRRLPSRTSTA